eukprot:scaffold58427_cov69-Phaeocystis_antarctica.AAC.6
MPQTASSAPASASVITTSAPASASASASAITASCTVASTAIPSVAAPAPAPASASASAAAFSRLHLQRRRSAEALATLSHGQRRQSLATWAWSNKSRSASLSRLGRPSAHPPARQSAPSPRAHTATSSASSCAAAWLCSPASRPARGSQPLTQLASACSSARQAFSLHAAKKARSTAWRGVCSGAIPSHETRGSEDTVSSKSAGAATPVPPVLPGASSALTPSAARQRRTSRSAWRVPSGAAPSGAAPPPRSRGATKRAAARAGSSEGAAPSRSARCCRCPPSRQHAAQNGGVALSASAWPQMEKSSLPAASPGWPTSTGSSRLARRRKAAVAPGAAHAHQSAPLGPSPSGGAALSSRSQLASMSCSSSSRGNVRRRRNKQSRRVSERRSTASGAALRCTASTSDARRSAAARRRANQPRRQRPSAAALLEGAAATARCRRACRADSRSVARSRALPLRPPSEMPFPSSNISSVRVRVRVKANQVVARARRRSHATSSLSVATTRSYGTVTGTTIRTTLALHEALAANLNLLRDRGPRATLSRAHESPRPAASSCISRVRTGDDRHARRTLVHLARTARAMQAVWCAAAADGADPLLRLRRCFRDPKVQRSRRCARVCACGARGLSELLERATLLWPRPRGGV